ncbi:MAG TPA: transglycosylase domain-containing protein [Kineosporiaceae bacterium]|nr:transglycosylase domain-containing protein [Kineosporiaceae bacterium]
MRGTQIGGGDRVRFGWVQRTAVGDGLPVARRAVVQSRPTWVGETVAEQRQRGPRGRVLRPLAGLVAGGVLAGVLVAGLILPVAGGTGAAVTGAGDFFLNLPSDLVTVGVPRTSVLQAADGSVIADFYAENRIPIPLAQMSPLVQQAVVAVEDSRFFQHGPLDARGLARAAMNNLSGGGTQGASTLTQQYVKNVLLEKAVAAGDVAAQRAAVAPTINRKVQELRYAIAVEKRLSKQEILQRYLNIVYFGERTYGVQAAALRYFGVSAADLTLPQAATLAGMVQDPGADNPLRHPAAARARRDVVLADMRNQGLIPPDRYAAAVASPLRITGHPAPEGCAAAGANAFFCSYVVRSLLTDPRYSVLGATRAARQHALETEGLQIRTTLDPATQAGTVAAVNRGIPADDSSGLATTSVTVEPGTGAVVAMAEDRAYAVAPGRGRTSVNYATDESHGGAAGFQTGSSFKPFTLATWLGAGHTLDETVDATRRAFPFPGFTACGHSLGNAPPYVPGNSEGTESGPMSVLTATSMSVNVAYVDMESQLDLCGIVRTATRLGVHTAIPVQVCSRHAPPSSTLPTCLPSLTLGVASIAPLTMAAAYAGFATGGVFCEPLPVTAISRLPSDEAPAAPVATYPKSCRPALEPQVASGVNQALSHVLTDGTAAAVGPLDPWPSAGKTGTTDGPYDSWFVGYTAQRSTAVWVGDPGQVVRGTHRRQRLVDVAVNGQYYPIIFGASIAAPIWKNVMETAMQPLPARPLP